MTQIRIRVDVMTCPWWVQFVKYCQELKVNIRGNITPGTTAILSAIWGVFLSLVEAIATVYALYVAGSDASTALLHCSQSGSRPCITGRLTMAN